jgi:hypothetical protein
MISGCSIKELKIMIHAHPRSLALRRLVKEGLSQSIVCFRSTGASENGSPWGQLVISGESLIEDGLLL